MFRVVHDKGKPVCLIGDTASARRTKAALAHSHTVEIARLEDVIDRSPVWYSQRQFLAITSDIELRLNIMSALQSRQLDWISVVGQHNVLHPDTKIGHGVFVGNFNDMSSENIAIGDHSHVSCYCQFAENVVIGEYCFVSGYTYINNCVLGTGCVIGLRSTICKLGSQTVIPAYTNFLANSMVTKPILESATYFGNRKTDTRDSRSYRIT